MAPEDFAAILLDAKEARAQAIQKRKDLSEILLAALRDAIPEGTVVDRRGVAGQPDCVLTLATTGGSDRGTSVFRICRILSVDADVDRPGHSRWSCDALPISEKTGKDMSPKAGNSRFGARTMVRLTGYALADCHAKTFDDQLARVADLVAGRPSLHVGMTRSPTSMKVMIRIQNDLQSYGIIWQFTVCGFLYLA